MASMRNQFAEVKIIEAADRFVHPTMIEYTWQDIGRKSRRVPPSRGCQVVSLSDDC